MKSQRTGKRPYERPRIRVIQLTAEEIMGKCKIGDGTGPSDFGCASCAQATGS